MLGRGGLTRLGSSAAGLTPEEVLERRRRHGPNRVEPPPPPSWWRLLARQFTSPLIFILIAAAAVAPALGEHWDAGSFAGVLVVNAVIGFVNEARAERKVRSLGTLVRTRTRVRRAGETLEVDGEELVPGDIVLLESGSRIPADIRLLEVHGLRVDEGLLTGESAPVHKDGATVPADTPLAERWGMVFGGTFIAHMRPSDSPAASTRLRFAPRRALPVGQASFLRLVVSSPRVRPPDRLLPTARRRGSPLLRHPDPPTGRTGASTPTGNSPAPRAA